MDSDAILPTFLSRNNSFHYWNVIPTEIRYIIQVVKEIGDITDMEYERTMVDELMNVIHDSSYSCHK